MKKTGLALLVLTLALTGLSCNLFKKNQTVTPAKTNESSSNNLTAADPKSIDNSLASYLNTAKTNAKGWKNDAILYYVSVKLPTDLAPGEANQTYVFGSTNDNNSWWTISIAEKSGKYIRATIPKEDYLGNTILPIKEQYWKINYLEAFQVAEKNGGKDFRTNNQNALVTINLIQGEPKGWLWWKVEYKAGNDNLKTIIINPSDSTIVDDNGNVASK